MRLYLGCGPSPVHQQHLQVLGNPDEWTFVDLYVHEPHIKNWDARTLKEVPDGSVDHIYASHLLEHFPHVEVPQILVTWNQKLKEGGQLTLNVPDLAWAAKQLVKHDQGGLLEGYYNTFEGEHGLISIFYGSQSHDGEYHKSGYTKRYLDMLLNEAGFVVEGITQFIDAHDMQVLVATAFK